MALLTSPCVSLAAFASCRVSWTVLPLLFLGTATNYLDRTALSFASLQMNADLQLSTEQYGLAAATFALGACCLAQSVLSAHPSYSSCDE